MTNPEMFDWAKQQMTSFGVPEEHAKLVERLLETYWNSNVPETFDRGTEVDFLRVFTELAQSHPLVAETPDEYWEAARPGWLTVADVVRVKSDAYSGAAGVMHNNRLGTIVAIRSGDIHVRYTDRKEPLTDSVRHSPYMLEKRIQ